MVRKMPTTCVADGSTAAGGGGKSKKKNYVIAELSEEPVVQEEKSALVGGKMKGKKGNTKKVELEEKGDDIVMKHVVDEVPAITFGVEKKSKRKKGGSFSKFGASSFGLLGDEEGDEEGVSGLTQERDGGDSEDVGENVLVFMGKKKQPKLKKAGGKILFSASAFDAIGDENDEGVIDDSVLGQHLDRDNEPLAVFSGKKKSSKSRNTHGGSISFAAVSDGLDEEGEESKDESKKQVNEGVAETSKNKKKKKKSGRTVQEEDELDKILAELGEGPSIPKPDLSPAPSPSEEKVQVLLVPEEGQGEKEAEEGSVESAAAKKKKKKEKEKEKKAAAAAEEKQEVAKNEIKGRVPNKKVPKHVREMQERLAKMKEAEERKKREEEERLRKEEEERLLQEELERLAEEKKRLKKEREKEKLLKKKLEGKLLTGKQKEEARRLEAMKKQILANSGGLLLGTVDADGVPAKRKPIYQKKSKPQNQANGAAPAEPSERTDSKGNQLEIVSEMDLKEIEKVEEIHVGEKPVVTDVMEIGIEKGDDDDEDWDAKSWDEAGLKLPGKSPFADEEVNFIPETFVKNKVKCTYPTAHSAVLPPASSEPGVVSQEASTSTAPPKSLNAESKKGGGKAYVIERELLEKKEASRSDTPPSHSEINLRSPICCIMGHVDAGKTKLLDCIRRTNVQEGEAGGITQQIGATYFPAESIRERTKELKADAKLNVPGLLVIDTPGHESFTNLRSRGSGLCDVAILVVDIMHGLQPQTIESLNFLRMRKTEFIVALNKVDRLYGWRTCPDAPIREALKQQSKDVRNEFNMRLEQVITQFKEQALNTELYYKNKKMRETSSIVPTSAISGEGIPDLLLLLVLWTQKTMAEKLTFSNQIQCTVLEVKVVEGHGTTIDVVLVNGVLREGDEIVVCGVENPIVTTIRALLTPHPMKELRVKGTYLRHKEIKAAQGIKITAQGLERAVAGTGLYVVGPNDDMEDIKKAARDEVGSVMGRIDKSGNGVWVQASTLGSLEALLEYLKNPEVNIPVCGISIGPVHKRDVTSASVMLEKKKEYATILAFDVKVSQEAQQLADELGIKIFCDDVIYHLFDQFKAYIGNLKEKKKKESAKEAVFPCVLKIIPGFVFNKKDPILLGVDVVEGIAKVGAPICIPHCKFIDIGRIVSIVKNNQSVDYAKKGQKVTIKIVGSNSDEQQKMFGRHFGLEDDLVSHISRRSIDILEEHFLNDLSIDDWKLVDALKILFKIR